jgi:hypothetical protein
LIQYEIRNRLNARNVGRSRGEQAHALLGRPAMVELVPPLLERAPEPFPVPLRTPDALYLASVDFLRSCEQRIELATYDDRLATAARAIGLPLTSL